MPPHYMVITQLSIVTLHKCNIIFLPLDLCMYDPTPYLANWVLNVSLIKAPHLSVVIVCVLLYMLYCTIHSVTPSSMPGYFHGYVVPVNLLASITTKILQCGKSFTFMKIREEVFRRYLRVSPRKYLAMELRGWAVVCLDSLFRLLVWSWLLTPYLALPWVHSIQKTLDPENNMSKTRWAEI